MNLPDRYRPGDHLVPREHMVQYAAIPMPGQQQRDFMDTVKKLWRHAGLILACTAAFAAITALIVWQLPLNYIASSKVLVGVPAPRALNIESIITDFSPTAERVENERYVLMSREVAKQVVDKLNLMNSPEFNPELQPVSYWRQAVRALNPARYMPDWFNQADPDERPTDPERIAQRKEDAIIGNVLSKVDVAAMGRSHILDVRVTSENPDTAAAVANAMAAAYIARQREDKIEQTNQVEQFLQNRVGELRKQVETADKAVEDYRRQNGLFRGANTEVTSQQLTELNTQMILAQTAKAEADSRLAEARTMQKTGVRGESVPDVLRSQVIIDLKRQQADSERKAAELASQYGDKHPRMQNAKAEIADIRAKIGGEIGRVVAGLQHEANATNARYTALQGHFDRLKGRMGTVNEKSIKLQALERDATVNHNLLEAMLKRARETVGQTELEQANARLISQAAPPDTPAFPPKMLLLFLGTLGGVLMGIVVAMVRDSADHTFRRRDQIEGATGLPVIAMVPALLGRTSPTAHVLRNPMSPFSEALRKIFVGLELSDPENPPKTVMFSSAMPAEGKSVLAASLGRLLASNGKRVLLIDCDWRCPSLHRPFRLANKGGLAALLTDGQANLDEIVVNDALSGVDVIVAGHWEPQNIHMLTSERMRLALKTFAKNYDLVILDSPPVLVGAEVLSLSRMVDKVLFAIRWGHTRRESVMEGLRQLVDARGNIAGVVMSRVDPKRYRQYAYGNLNYEYARPALTVG